MNTKHVSITTIKKIANGKGLVFEFNEADQSFAMLDKKTSEVLMTYANVTISLITNDKIWREECNKLKSQAFR